MLNQPDSKIKKDLQKKRDKQIRDAAKLRRLIDPKGNSGWLFYYDLLDNYINACKKRKLLTPLDNADDKTIHQIKLLDHEIYILNWARQIPMQFINGLEKTLEEERKKEESNENV